MGQSSRKICCASQRPDVHTELVEDNIAKHDDEDDLNGFEPGPFKPAEHLQDVGRREQCAAQQFLRRKRFETYFTLEDEETDRRSRFEAYDIHADDLLEDREMLLAEVAALGDVGALGEKLNEVHKLCLAARIIDAHKELKKIELAAETLSEGHDFVSRLKSDVVVLKLQRVHSRIIAGLERVLMLLPRADRLEEERWGKHLQAAPEIHPDCTFEILVRFLMDHEKDPKKRPTQFVIIFNVWNCSITMQRQVALHSQSDLVKAEWDSGCRTFEGWPGGKDQLYSTVFSKIKKSPMPFQSDTELAVIRDLSVCAEAPLPGYPPGVLSVDSPVAVLEAEDGWYVPAPKPGIPRSSLEGFDYIMPGDHLDTCHIMFAVSMDIAVPQWLIPLDFGTKILGKMAIGTLNSVKSLCWDHFDKTGLDERMVELPEFVDAMKSLGKT